jgi:hypothetical protein
VNRGPFDRLQEDARHHRWQESGESGVHLHHYAQKRAKGEAMSPEERTKNTHDLLAFFAEKRAKAASNNEGSTGIVREVATKSAWDSEWYTLNSALAVPLIYQLFDGSMVARRLDEMMAELRAASAAREAL